MTRPMANQIPSCWRCVDCDTELELPATSGHHVNVAGEPLSCSWCGGEDFEQSRGLTPVAIATLAMAGITAQQWIAAANRGYVPPDGEVLTWNGDLCGCTDDRCANGFHHMGLTDCQCLPVLIDQYYATGEI